MHVGRKLLHGCRAGKPLGRAATAAAADHSYPSCESRATHFRCEKPNKGSDLASYITEDLLLPTAVDVAAAVAGLVHTRSKVASDGKSSESILTDSSSTWAS